MPKSQIKQQRYEPGFEWYGYMAVWPYGEKGRYYFTDPRTGKQYQFHTKEGEQRAMEIRLAYRHKVKAKKMRKRLQTVSKLLNHQSGSDGWFWDRFKLRITRRVRVAR